MLRIYGLKDQTKKKDYINVVQAFFPETENKKSKCLYSNKGNLKGLVIYPTGSKKILGYVDLLNKKVYYLEKRKVVETKNL